MQVRVARAYLLVQAIAGALWWVSVFTVPAMRSATLGAWSPHLLVIPDLLLFVGLSAYAAVRDSWRAAAIVALWTVALDIGLFVQGLVFREAGWGALAMLAAAIGSVAAAMTLRSGYLPTKWYFVGRFSFRPAPARSRRGQVAASLAQLVIFWVSFFVIVPWVLRRVEDRLRIDWPALGEFPWPTVGLVMFLVATPLGLWSCLTMAIVGDGTPLPAQTARRLVVRGPYRWLRNPMATAGVVQSFGMGLVFGSWTMLVLAIAGALAWHLGIRPTEEADLVARFGEPYLQYRDVVRCWIPGTRPFAVGAPMTGWRA